MLIATGCKRQKNNETENDKEMRLPGVEPGSIAWKAIILTVGLQTQERCNEQQIRCRY